MKNYICILASVALFTACENKETTVTNPPGDNKTETNNTVVKEPGAAAKTENKTETNVNTSSSPGTSTSTSTSTSSSPNP
ncbi:MAG: hypothetical protein ABJB69_02645 [Spartobacteria bacterium]